MDRRTFLMAAAMAGASSVWGQEKKPEGENSAAAPDATRKLPHLPWFDGTYSGVADV